MPQNPPKADPLPAWSDQDAAILRDYLGRNPNFRAWLRHKRPKVTATETTEARSLSASVILGAETMLEVIEDMARGPQTQQEESPFIGAGEA